MTGPVPHELGDLYNLEWLSLDGNQLAGMLPSSLTDLTALWRFIFNDNEGLCAPSDAEFQAWLHEIDFVEGDTCEA